MTGERRIPCAGLKTDRKGPLDSSDLTEYRVPMAAHGARAELSPVLVEDAEARSFRVNVQTNVPHSKPPFRPGTDPAYTDGIVSRSASDLEACFIVSLFGEEPNG